MRVGAKAGNNSGQGRTMTDASLPEPERAAAPPENALALRGARIDRYLLKACIAADRRREVFRAYDPAQDRDVVIRLMRDAADPEAAHRTLVQARALTRLEHRNVQRLHDVGTHWGRVFVALEPGRDPTLAAWLRVGQSFERRAAALIEAGEGLAAAHAAGIVHGDFSTITARVRNIGTTRNTVPATYVVEFAAERGLQLASVGTTAYMAPELFDGAAPSERSDQFAYCVATFVALTGAWPYTGDTYDTRAASVRSGRIQLDERARALPPGVLDALMRGLAVDARDRWPSMDALLDVLRRALQPS